MNDDGPHPLDPSPWSPLPSPPRTRGDGSILWSTRPFARSWSIRRLGWYGTLEALQPLASARDAVLFAASDDDDLPRTLTFRQALRLAGDLRSDERHLWIVARSGRWHLEVSADGRCTFEYVTPDPPAMRRDRRPHVIRRNS